MYQITLLLFGNNEITIDYSSDSCCAQEIYDAIKKDWLNRSIGSLLLEFGTVGILKTEVRGIIVKEYEDGQVV